MFGFDDMAGAFLGYEGQREANFSNERNVENTNYNNLLIARERNEAEARNIAAMNAANRQNIDAQNAANTNAAREARAWEESMSSSAYQRQVKDMEAAGLNPMLAIMKGNGASTPSVAAPHMEGARDQAPSVTGATMQAPVVGNTLDYLGRGLSSAARLRLEEEDVNTRRRDAETRAQANENLAMVQDAQREVMESQIRKMVADIDNQNANTKLTLMGLDKAAEEMGLIRANKALSLANARAVDTRLGYEENESRARADEIRARIPYVGATVQQQAGRSVKELADWLRLKLDGQDYEEWSGSWGRITPGDAYGRGVGNVYGGRHSAKRIGSTVHW